MEVRWTRRGSASQRLGALAVVHPFPSAVNALAVLGIAVIAGATTWSAVTLAVGMLGLQFCIGAVNDLADHDLDARTKSWKPIPAGRITRPATAVVAAISGGGGMALAASEGPVVASMAAVMLGAGLAYDLVLKGTPWSWVAYTVALPVLPLYAWWGAADALPPRVELLIPIAVLAGPALQLTNALVDLERDTAGGVASLATVVGRRAGLALSAVVLATIHTIAWATLVMGGASPAVLLPALASTALAVVGVRLSSAPVEPLRERGWQAQTISLALLAVAWLAAASAG